MSIVIQSRGSLGLSELPTLNRTYCWGSIFGDVGTLREWFAQLILYFEAVTLSGIYVPFDELAAGVLRILGEIRQVKVSDAEVAELRQLIKNIPPHSDVAEALRRLKNAGFRLATLTNSPPSQGSAHSGDIRPGIPI